MPDEDLKPQQFIIGKTFRFSAAHHLTKVDPGHKCFRMHGHNYTVEVALIGALNDQAMVLDYDLFSPFGDFLRDYVDHRLLNEIMPGETTAEVLAWWFAHKFRLVVVPAPTDSYWELHSVTVREGDNTFATITFDTQVIRTGDGSVADRMTTAP